MQPNIYPVIVFKINKKIRDYIDKLNREGQIDLDASKHPIVYSIKNVGGSVYTIEIQRNGVSQTITMNTRIRKEDPIISWKEDGFVRNDEVNIPQVSDTSVERKKKNVDPYENVFSKI